jgi:enoyl-CoA hydratase/carnithine racemase
MTAAEKAEFVPATDELLYERRGAVAFLTFNRPQARNALTWAMYEGLYACCEHVDADDRVMNAIEGCKVPTIAAINGACTGGGASIAACCDLRIASRSMKYGFPVARTLGNCLSLASYNRLVYLVGPSLVKDIVFQARLVEAEEALARGLVMELHADQAALLKRGEELARTVAGMAPLTLQATKEAVLRLRPRIPHGEGNDLVLMCYMSQDFREGMDAFLNKRKPVWKGQ